LGLGIAPKSRKNTKTRAKSVKLKTWEGGEGDLMCLLTHKKGGWTGKMPERNRGLAVTEGQKAKWGADLQKAIQRSGDRRKCNSELVERSPTDERRPAEGEGITEEKRSNPTSIGRKKTGGRRKGGDLPKKKRDSYLANPEVSKQGITESQRGERMGLNGKANVSQIKKGRANQTGSRGNKREGEGRV